MTEAAGADTRGVAGVGMTALLVAAARAIETNRPDALARDEYAAHFVRAVPACAGWPLRPEEVPNGDGDPLWGRLGRFFGLRTRVFDDFLLHAAGTGGRQVVLLGAGLDTRAHRLPWPDGCTVFEVDQPEVLAFKQSALDDVGGLSALDGRDALGRRGDSSRAERVVVSADLRDDWTAGLVAAGFDPELPTAWLAEGLVPYLPPAAELDLIGTIHAYSRPGSMLAYEIKQGVNPLWQRDFPVYAAVRERLGIDLLALFSPEPRPDSAGDLAGRGWSTAVRTPFHFTRRHGRGPLPAPDDALAANRWVFAALGTKLPDDHGPGPVPHGAVSGSA
ncbi:class I SAM-dependent methyltransferase [Streptomyces sp. NPDC057428]|uniref:class I SAM-dependent methyltransferase n=1 Tax=Streptomyces sp. NPDC057428 TaxID=3346129 RepID=UPI0036B3A1C6